MHILLAVVLQFALRGSFSSCSEFVVWNSVHAHLKFTCWGLLGLHNASIIWRGVLSGFNIDKQSSCPQAQ